MNAKEYLEQYRRIKQEIVWRTEQIEKIRTDVSSYHPIQLDDSGASHLNYREDKTLEKVTKIIGLTNELEQRICDLHEKESEIRNTVLQLKDVQEREVLMLRYLTPHPRRAYAPLGWKEISSRMKYTKQGILKLHSRALKHLTDILNKPSAIEEKVIKESLVSGFMDNGITQGIV